MVEGLGFGRRRLIQKIIETHWPNDSFLIKNFSFNELLFVIQELMYLEGRPYLEGYSPMMGYQIFRQFVQHLLYRNLANYDSLILITADKGMGKSSAAIMIAREWMRMLGRKFDVKRHIAYNNADVMRKIDLLEKFEVIVCDEAVRFATATEWAKRENRELKKKLAQVRTKHLLYILCFPLKVYRVEKNYLDSFTNYWIDLYARGKGIIYVKDKNPASDTWRIKDFSKLGSYTEFSDMHKVEELLKRHPNFWSIIKFPKPPDWLYSKYMNVREKNVYDEDSVMESVSREDIYNALLILSLRDIMMSDTTLTMNRILLHIRNQYDIGLTKQMIQTAIDDARQLVSRIKEQTIKEI